VNTVRMEAFLSTSGCFGDDCLCRLLEQIGGEFRGKVKITVHRGHNDLFEEYSLTRTPALVIEDLVKIMGFCPSKETVVAALKEVGVE